MKSIILIIKELFKIKTYIPPLGRWKIETCYKKLNNKIDLANEDHCGPCGKYIHNRIIDQQKNKIKL
jgi:hypothetical protein